MNTDEHRFRTGFRARFRTDSDGNSLFRIRNLRAFAPSHHRVESFFAFPNKVIHADGNEEPLPSKATLHVEAGMSLRIETPGGGGYGGG